MLKIGQLVRGTVTRCEPYGVYVEIGESEPAMLLLDALLDDDPGSARSALPEIGVQIEAALLGYGRISIPRKTGLAPGIPATTHPPS